MYTCNSCKKNFSDEPAMIAGKNHALKFCQQCRDESRKKSSEAIKERYAEIAAQNQCLWCGDKLTDNSRSQYKGGSETINLCKKCDSRNPHRLWLVKCLENSDQILKYINNEKRQEQWKQTREAKTAARQRKAAELIKLPLLENKPINPIADAVDISESDRELFKQFMAFKAMMNKASR